MFGKEDPFCNTDFFKNSNTSGKYPKTHPITCTLVLKLYKGPALLLLVLNTKTMACPSTENAAVLQFVSPVALQSIEHCYTLQYNRKAGIRNSSILPALGWDLIFQASDKVTQYPLQGNVTKFYSFEHRTFVYLHDATKDSDLTSTMGRSMLLPQNQCLDNFNIYRAVSNYSRKNLHSTVHTTFAFFYPLQNSY